MALSPIYDQFDDPQLGITKEELETFDMVEFCMARTNELVQRGVVAYRHYQLPDLWMPGWWRAVSDGCFDKASWYCRKTGLEGIDRRELRNIPMDSLEGKTITKKALSIEEEGPWLQEWEEELDRDLNFFVTICRRKSFSWNRSEKSLCNGLTNAILQEAMLIDHLGKQLRSNSG
jgi:hypothetical protein